MGGARGVGEVCVVSRMLILIDDDCSHGIAVADIDTATVSVGLHVHARGEHGQVGLFAGGSPGTLTGRTARHEGKEGLLGEAYTAWEARKCHADLGIVRAAENGKAQIVSVCVGHIFPRYFKRELKSSQNAG